MTKKPLNLIRLAIAVVLAITGVTISSRAQQPPPGYLGPMQPIPSGPTSPGASGPPGPLVAGVLPNVRVNDKVDDAPDRTQSETSVAVDPTNLARLVGAFNDCRGFFVPSRNGISGWGFSLDGATTWTGVQTGLPKANAADFGTRGDPSVDVDANGNFYYASLYARNPNPGIGPFDVSVHRGQFTGTTFVWQTPVLATAFASGFGADKEHVGVDHRPGTNTVYVSYTNFSAGGNGQIEIVRSTDGGATWSAPVVIAPASGTVHQGSIPRVGPNGEIYVAWEDGFFQPTRSIHIRKSTAWPNFGPDITLSGVTPVADPPFNSRINEFPTMDVDGTNGPNRGRVYVAWNDGLFGGTGNIGAILLSHSADGTTWTAPIMVNDDGSPSVTGTHHWFPWLAVNPQQGVVNIGFYDRRLRGASADLTDVFAAQFTPSGGVSANQRLTSLSFSMNVPSACTPNFGDYNGAAASSTNFHFLYGDGREGNPDTYSAGVGPGGGQHVHSLFWGGSSWNDADLTVQGGGPPAAAGTALTSYAYAPSGGARYVHYLTGDRHVHVLWWNGINWSDVDLTAVAGGPPAAAGTALTSYIVSADGSLHLNYLTGDGHVHELYDYTSWLDADLTVQGGGPPAAAGTALTSYIVSVDNSRHVNYLTGDGHVHELYFYINWNDADLTVQGGGPPAVAGTALTSFVQGGNRFVEYLR